ncbi:MAG TPA: hypothetical protein VHM64_20250 [Candidatus Binatia bacterium]|nr:hypothetical protein [Candidatus Binatia bacterium]
MAPARVRPVVRVESADLERVRLAAPVDPALVSARDPGRVDKP